MEALRDAIRDSNLKAFKKILNGKNNPDSLFDIDAKDVGRGMALLHLAIMHKNPEICSYLLNLGADINIKTTKSGSTPLMLCASTGENSCCKVLLSHGSCSSKIKNAAQQTALDLATLRRKHEIAILIREHDTAENEKRINKLREKVRMSL